MKFETMAIHEGQQPDLQTGAVVVPVYQTSTYQQDGIGRPRGYEYSRTGNPTRTALETALAALDGAWSASAFASGVAATTAVMHALLRPGDHVLAAFDLYGGTFRLFEKVFRPWGLEISYEDTGDLERFLAQKRANTRMVWVETPSNPLLKIVDLRALADQLGGSNVKLVVDNTFASPYVQRPLELGGDLVVYSTTKYIGGHSDLIGGAVTCKSEEDGRAIKMYQNAAGAVPGPWDCWLTLRGLKTLAVRMDRHSENAMTLAERLENHSAVERVFYPGLRNHPGHEIAVRQMRGFGGMISIELRGGFPAVEKFVGALKLFILGESLGGVESLVCYPPRMTHASFSRAERERRGIRDSLVRLSVGLEHVEDLWADLEQALSRL